MTELVCANCKTSAFLKEILYGMPASDYDQAKFHLGGCMPGNATVHCSKCDWEDAEGFIEFPAIF
jgi:hypothetical protein